MKNKNKYTRNIKVFISFIILTITLMNVLTISSYDVYAIEKPTYGDWIKDLYGYDENMPSDELDEKIKEDEAGRVFYKNPKTLTYEEFNGQAQVISETSGFMISGSRLGNSHYVLPSYPGQIDLPYYNQNDYGNVKYGSSNVKKSGCFLISTIMVIEGLTGQQIDIEEFANWASPYYQSGEGTYWTFPGKALEKYGLKHNRLFSNNPQSIIEALANGHPVLMSCGPGEFTSEGHMIVLNGIDENGMVSVLDPNKIERCKQYHIDFIMLNASGKGADPFWEVYK